MKKWLSLLLIMIMTFSITLTASAEGGKVIYDGNAKEFIFEPGSEYSVTDLFPDLKGVMPGNTYTQKITVKNAASNKVKVKVYMRALGAHEESAELLSYFNMKISKADDNEMAYMFDAAADQTAQLTDWYCLGTLYSGGEVNLDVILDVSTELDNSHSFQVGYLDWEFMIEEFPIEDTDPEAPKTGDSSNLFLWTCTAITSGAAVGFLILGRRKKEENN